MSQITVSLSPDELEVLIRRIVREELIRLLRTSSALYPRRLEPGRAR